MSDIEPFHDAALHGDRAVWGRRLFAMACVLFAAGRMSSWLGGTDVVSRGVLGVFTLSGIALMLGAIRLGAYQSAPPRARRSSSLDGLVLEVPRRNGRVGIAVFLTALFPLAGVLWMYPDPRPAAGGIVLAFAFSQLAGPGVVRVTIGNGRLDVRWVRALGGSRRAWTLASLRDVRADVDTLILVDDDGTTHRVPLADVDPDARQAIVDAVIGSWTRIRAGAVGSAESVLQARAALASVTTAAR